MRFDAAANFADPLGQDKPQTSGASLLVGLHSRNQTRGGSIRPRWKRTNALDQTNEPRCILCRKRSAREGEIRGGHHSPGNSFAVEIFAISGHAFERMRERM